ncbi:GGDEF domain-containing protein [Thiocystis violascens]|uniref:diguanylate cyclase n=1 Tax=Thiocystis violascens (strain ATCC 17096 / DSM 198 / 6111) TaxID=765911 RepID=I3Y6Y0_THIV6|nr:diguanylate cyclase [Thiocystis violascens]AFL72748.1 diguanylate cyclase (GGDEF) domain-containing protein [Thiocystis violascens DSM 198]
MRILIAEDDLTSRVALAGILRKIDHDVIETVNGADALEVLKRPDAPALAILDWMMPQMDGMEVVRRVRSLPTDRPPYLIMLTAKGEKADIVAGLDGGADDYLAKPFDPGELGARIEVGRRLIEMQAQFLAARNALAHEATHDPLTGLLNRRAILDALARQLSRERRRHPDGLAVGICDIDHFKLVNDTYGHLVGDEVLCRFARILESNLRPYDFLGRFGGEEFVVITPLIEHLNVRMLYQRFLSAISDRPIPTKAGQVPVTISIGVKIWSADEDVDAMLMAADRALYRAKSAGRNRICLADEFEDGY